ncbi:MAG: SDR family oxidoreductase [Actinobacteria bacterium]|nr:SDR family oxidoreductase [Actinomycetota bacterium]
MARPTADRFLDMGAVVFLADVDAGGLDAAVADLTGEGRSVHGIVADVTRVADCRRAVATVVQVAGRLDLLVNAAGVWLEGPTAEMTEDDWDRTIDVNLKGTFFCCRFAIPELVKTSGCIVNISSDAGVAGTAGAAIYNASKGGVNLLTQSLALELAPHDVRVNAICPTDVDTPMLAGQARDYGGGDPQAYLDRLLAAYPQGERARFVRPEEVAELIVFLASPRVAPITGARVMIDFGLTAGY